MSARKRNRKKKGNEAAEETAPGFEVRDRRSSVRDGEREASGAGRSGPGDRVPDEDGPRSGAAPEVGSAEILEQLQRLQAEFDNYRKRVRRERSEAWDLAKRELLLALLPFIDDISRIGGWDEAPSDANALLEGMRLSVVKLMSILEEEGFERIDALGKPFDPNVHEALLTQDVDDPGQDDTVGEVLVAGYLFKGALLRPARVKVLKYRVGGKEEAAGADGEGGPRADGGPGEGEADGDGAGS